MDVKALYPSLSREWVKKILFQMMQETRVKIVVKSWNELALYIALTHKQEEINEAGLEDVVHKRRYEAGPRPGITTMRAFSMMSESGEEDKWQQLKCPPTETKCKRIIAMATITAVEAVMANHIYSFNNIWRKQHDGGAIGNLLTGEVAKVVMAWWTKRFNELSATATPDPVIVEDSDSLYVDDITSYFTFWHQG